MQFMLLYSGLMKGWSFEFQYSITGSIKLGNIRFGCMATSPLRSTSESKVTDILRWTSYILSIQLRVWKFKADDAHPAFQPRHRTITSIVIIQPQDNNHCQPGMSLKFAQEAI